MLIVLALTIHWAAYYTDVPPPGGFAGFDLLVLDRDAHPPLQPLIARGTTVLGYISVGEVENNRAYFNDVRAQGILHGENPNWKGSFFVDVRDRRWRDRVKLLVRDTVKRGFHGVFLDTVDNAEYLEDSNPEKFRGMAAAMASLIQELRREFPGTKLAVNRGLSILPKVASSIDYILGESIYADYDFDSKLYRPVPEKVYAEQVAILKAAAEQNPKLTVLTLDYWNPNDTAGIAEIYRKQRANGFHPYVATVNLDSIVREPQ